jgi:uncharacterized protein
MTAPGVLPVANILLVIVNRLVDHPEAVRIESTESEGNTTFTIVSDPPDIGKIIGKQGRTARAIRTILVAISKVEGHQYTLDIEGPTPDPNLSEN